MDERAGLAESFQSARIITTMLPFRALVIPFVIFTVFPSRNE